MKKIVEDLEKRGIEKYTIFKLDKPFPFYLLDLNKYNISRPYYASFFKYITIEFWDLGYNVVFYDEKERYATHKSSGFAKEGKAIEYFNEVLLDISQWNDSKKVYLEEWRLNYGIHYLV